MLNSKFRSKQQFSWKVRQKWKFSRKHFFTASHQNTKNLSLLIKNAVKNGGKYHLSLQM